MNRMPEKGMLMINNVSQASCVISRVNINKLAWEPKHSSTLPAVDHELVDGSRASRGRGLVVPCVDLSENISV